MEFMKELLALNHPVNESTDTPKVGDQCKADPVEEGDYIFGEITKIDEDAGLAWSDLDWGEREQFCGDLPTRKEDGVWVFDGF